MALDLRGLGTYVQVVIAPRRAFARLSGAPTWGWAAVGGLVLTVLAALLAARAQSQMMAVIEAHRMAALPPGDRLREQLAIAQVAGLRRSILIGGALAAPWLAWALTAIFFFVASAVGRGRPNFSSAWVAALNAYAVYGVVGVVNAVLLALAPSSAISAPDNLMRLPSPAWLFPHGSAWAAFLTAYNVGALWYYAVVSVALQTLLRMPAAAAMLASAVFSLLFGALAAFGGTARP